MTCGRCQTGPDPATDLRVLMETLLARQERLEAMLAQIVPPPDREPTPPPPVPALVLALEAAFGQPVFTSREAWERARTSDAALWGALEAEGIKGVHHLGRWLGDHVGAGVERSKPERDGSVWHCGLVRFRETT